MTDIDIDALYSYWPGQLAPAAPLPEAPVSITLKGFVHGQEVMVTLRGTDFASVKAQIEEAAQWMESQPVHEEHWCARHGVALEQQHKNGQSWWSHKATDGWCKG